MPGSELPPEVEAFLLVGRILERCRESNECTHTGVARYHVVKFGAGQQHAGLPVFYGPGGGKKDAKGKAQQVPMDTEFQFAVFWEGQEEPEMLSMEEIRPLSTDRFVDEPWLPAGIRALVKDGWDRKWSELSMDSMRAFLDAAKDESSRELAAAKRQQAAAQRKAQAPRKAPAACAPKGRPVAKKEDAPLVAADGVAAALEAKKQARKRKAMEASAAAAAAGSPPKRVSLPGWVARLPGAPVGAAARGTPAAAAAATMSPSCGPASPGGCAQSNQPGAGAHKRRQQVQQEVQQQEQQQGTSSSSLAPTQQQQQQEKQRKGAGKAAGAGGKASSGNKSKQTLLSPAPSRKAGGAAEPSGRKARVATAAGAAAAAGAPSPAKSDRQRSTGSAQDVPDVLRQHESKAVAPEDSDYLRRAKRQFERVASSNGSKSKVFWYDRVQSSDGAIYRVYNQALVVPDALCFRAKTDRRLRTWKRRASEEGDFDVEAVLAEEEDRKGRVRYLVKWKGYEADPDDDSWLHQKEMTHCNRLLDEWKQEGRAEWELARRQLLDEAGLA